MSKRGRLDLASLQVASPPQKRGTPVDTQDATIEYLTGEVCANPLNKLTAPGRSSVRSLRIPARRRHPFQTRDPAAHGLQILRAARTDPARTLRDE